MTLAEFLLARIAEDESVVRAATAPGEMHPYGDPELSESSIDAFPDQVRGYLGGTWGEHCARWSFERVLAECEAKRRIVKAARMAIQNSDNVPDDTEHARIHGYATGLEMVLDLIALPYASHPDYLEEWL